MTLFSIQYFTLILLYIFSFQINKSDKLTIYFFLTLLVMLIFALRGNILPDYGAYKEIFELWSIDDYFSTGTVLSNVELFYGLLNNFFNIFTFEFFIIFLLFFSVYTKYYILTSKLQYIGIIAFAFYISKYFVFYELVTIRQGLASIFLLLSLFYFAELKKIKSLVFIIIAFLFHKASILFIVIFLYKYLFFLIKPKNILFILFIFIVANPLDFMIDSLNKIGILPDIVYYYYYVSQETTEGSSVLSIQSLIKTGTSLIVYYIVYRKITLNYLQNFNIATVALYLYGIEMLLRTVFFTFSIVAGRGSSLFILAEVIAVAVTYKLSSKYYKIIIFSYYLFLLILTLLSGEIYHDYRSILT